MGGTSMIFLAVNTPTKVRGNGQKMACDTKNLENIIRSISHYFSKIEMQDNLIIIEKSTVPLKTCEWIERVFMEDQLQYPANKEKFAVLSNPEFLAEGKPKFNKPSLLT